jgi:hypothetical protein
VSETPVVRIALLGGLTVTVGPLVVADAAWPTRRAAELVACWRSPTGTGWCATRAGQPLDGARCAHLARNVRGTPA